MARKRSSKDKKKNLSSEREPWTPWGKWLKRRRERKERKRRAREERKRQRREVRRRRRMRRRLITTRGLVFVGFMLVACLIGGIVILLLGRPYPWEAVTQVQTVLQLNRMLEERQARWDSLAVTDYRVEIEYLEHVGDAHCGPATVEVRGGEIAEMPTARDTHWFPAERCEALFEQLTIDMAYDWLTGQITIYQPAETYLQIEFNDSFGHPVYAEAGVYNEEDQTAGCCWQVTWKNLRPLSTEENE